jgi:hypothetical protein
VNTPEPVHDTEPAPAPTTQPDNPRPRNGRRAYREALFGFLRPIPEHNLSVLDMPPRAQRRAVWKAMRKRRVDGDYSHTDRTAFWRSLWTGHFHVLAHESRAKLEAKKREAAKIGEVVQTPVDAAAEGGAQ